ncbi:MAG TPA: alpha/beta hydrolase [Acidimicrobiales bacterium]|nr:alpha/beta hydrolase [Acidimicrobiales bacterium]
MGTVSEQMGRALDEMWKARQGGLDAPRPPLQERRDSMELIGDMYPLPDGTEESQVVLDEVPGVWLTRADSGSAVILYLHGGGHQIGSANCYREMVARVLLHAPASALLIDYRLAPEHPFPSSLDDALAAYRWLLARGTSPASIGIAGDSSGGGLVVALLLELRAAGVELPGAVALLSPWLDLAGTGESLESRAERDPLVTRHELLLMAGEYLAGADPLDPRASPLFGDPAGFPPVLIQVGSEEILYDDSARFAQKAQDAGVDVCLEVWDGMPHVWQVVADAPEAWSATERIGKFFAEHLK